MSEPNRSCTYLKLMINSVTKSRHGSNVLLSAEMMHDRQLLSCYVMCSEIGEFALHSDWMMLKDNQLAH